MKICPAAPEMCSNPDCESCEETTQAVMRQVKKEKSRGHREFSRRDLVERLETVQEVVRLDRRHKEMSLGGRCQEALSKAQRKEKEQETETLKQQVKLRIAADEELKRRITRGLFAYGNLA